MSRKKLENPLTFNIQSYIRVRPLEASEKRSAHFTFSKKEILIKGANSYPRSLTFDRVFDEDVKQAVVYSNVVKPMVKEVLDGYNCTVFAYGQTGTGKTHTMTGEFDGTSPRDCPQSGIIPRALEEIFNELALLNQEHVVTITFIELYNEKLISLISDDSDIGLAEGADGNVVFKNLNPIPVNTIGEAMKLLQIGNEKRSTASTNINATSSRSHSIFTITVKIKEPKIDSEELRTAKLHLVDLAGSENVTKSGVNNMPKTQDKAWSVSSSNTNPRFNETIKINVSLLVLRRVILSLTENAYHVPYRESKLTRLLMDSLGGKTKTCIIGTISPSQINQEESESTLNYAVKARSIKNKPVKNTTESKKEFLQFAYEEISRLKRDLEANRQGDGFFISQESYNEMTDRMKQLSDQVKSWSERYCELNKSYEQQNALYEEVYCDLMDKKVELDQAENMFRHECEKVEKLIYEKKLHVDLREYLIHQYNNSQEILTAEALDCKSVVEILYNQCELLHNKIDRKTAIETKNVAMMEEVKQAISQKADAFNSEVTAYHVKQKNKLEGVMDKSSKSLETLCDCHNDIKATLLKFESSINKNCDELEQHFGATQNKRLPALKQDIVKLKETLVEETLNMKNALINGIKIHTDELKAKFNEANTVTADMLKNAQELLEVTNNYSELHNTHVDNFNGFKQDICEQLDKVVLSAAETLEKNSIVENSSDVYDKLLNIKKLIEEVTQASSDTVKDAQCTMELLNINSGSIAEVSKFAKLANLEKQNIVHDEIKSNADRVVSNAHTLVDKVDTLRRENETEQEKALQILNAVASTSLVSLEGLCGDASRIHSNIDEMSTKLAPIGETIEAMNETSKETIKSLVTKIQDSDREAEAAMRIGNETLAFVLNETENLQETSKSFEQNLKEVTNGGKRLVVDAPTGFTPKRMNSKSELRYPSQFHAAPTYNRLLETFSSTKTPAEQLALIDIGQVNQFTSPESKQMEGARSLLDLRQCSLQGETSGSSEYSTAHSETSCATQPDAITRQLRRSVSMSALNLAETEDKENRRTTEAKGKEVKVKPLARVKKAFTSKSPQCQPSHKLVTPVNRQLTILGVSPDMIKDNKDSEK